MESLNLDSEQQQKSAASTELEKLDSNVAVEIKEPPKEKPEELADLGLQHDRNQIN